MKVALAVLSFVALSWAAPAFAQSTSPNQEADGLVKQIDDGLAGALGADCSVACRALDSMRHATDRLCGIEPGERCVAARDKLRRAGERVHASCPDCANEPRDGVGVNPDAPTPRSPSPPSPAPTDAEAVSRRHGGCAGCTTSAAETHELPFLLAITLAALIIRRRRDR